MYVYCTHNASGTTRQQHTKPRRIALHQIGTSNINSMLHPKLTHPPQTLTRWSQFPSCRNNQDRDTGEYMDEWVSAWVQTDYRPTEGQSLRSRVCGVSDSHTNKYTPTSMPRVQSSVNVLLSVHERKPLPICLSDSTEPHSAYRTRDA